MTRDDVISYLLDERGKPFEWGVSDCVTLAAGLIRRCTGRDVLDGFTYSSEIEAKRELVARGGLEAAVTAVLGAPSHDMRRCADGDIVLTVFDGQKALGVAVPRYFFVRRLEGGVIPVDLALAIRYWPCPA